MDIILASSSPRRKELFKKIADNFRIIPSRFDEKKIREKDPVRFALKAAAAKAKDIGSQNPHSLVFAADTIVVLGEEILGKPENLNQAREMLSKLSGKKHRVITGIAFYKKNEKKLLSDFEVSYVKFKDLGPQDIEQYLGQNSYLDKAGSYAVQETGDSFVEKLEGDYDNVVGLPVEKTKTLLKEFLSGEILLTISDLAFPNNWGVGKKGELTLFVPGAVFGDQVKVRPAKRKKKYLLAETLSLEKPSPYRVKAPCPHFGFCGGCAFQNLDYKKQTELKQNYLLKTLQKIGNIDIEAAEISTIIPSPDVFFYRNKMEFAFGEDQGEVALGLRERSSPLKKYSRRTVPLKKCFIFSAAAENILPLVIDFARKSGLPAYNTLTNKGFFRHLVLREGKNSRELMLILVTASGKELNLKELADKLNEEIPRIKSLWWAENNRVSDVVVLEKKHLISGREFIKEKLGDLQFRIYPESFFQPNVKAARILYELIREQVKLIKANRVLGLYCGPGSIEIYISDAVKEVMGIDSEEANISAAEENSRLNGRKNCGFYRESVEKKLIDLSGEDFDALIIDPPRAGLSGKALKRAAALRIPAIIYISCNPSTLARDLSLLGNYGYKLKKLYPVDFFPHTTHLESLSLLEV